MNITEKHQCQIFDGMCFVFKLDFPAKPKGQLQKENDEQFLKFMKQQEQKETGLYEMLQEYMVENESLRLDFVGLYQFVLVFVSFWNKMFGFSGI